MNYSDVKKELKKEFESILKPLGFKSKTDTQGCRFVKSDDCVEYRFGFGVSNYIDEFYTSPFGSFGLKKIQRIENLIFQEVANYDTLLMNKSDYFNELNYRFKIKTQEDIIDWGKIVRKFYEEYAVPFFWKV